MISRILFAVVILFFIVMNVLLWRSEILGAGKVGAPIPAGVVWQKIISAPDNSSLEIRHHDQKVGYCTWTPAVGEELATGKQMTEGPPPPEGMVRTPSGYTIDFDGSAAFMEEHRLRFNFSVQLGTNYVWQEIMLRLNFRPAIFEVRSVAAEENVHVTIEDGGKVREQVYTFAQLQNPEHLLHQFGGSFVVEVLKSMGLPLDAARFQANSFALEWEARNDWLRVGHARLRVYRLQARLLDRFQAVIYVSNVGEILRVELPDDIVFMNVALTNL